MAEEVQLDPIAANRPWPAPPPFYLQFSAKNVNKLRDLKSQTLGEAAKDASLFDSDSLHSLDVPDELRYLIPPKPPADGKYRVFTETRDLSGGQITLEDQNIDQVYPTNDQFHPLSSQHADTEWTVDRVYYLKKLSKSILLKFLELVGILSIDSTRSAEAVQELKQLIYNVHSLINDYRQHQARETVILMMEDQLEKKRAELEEVRTMKARINVIMAGIREMAAKNASVPVDGAKVVSVETEQKRTKQRRIWAALEAEMT